MDARSNPCLKGGHRIDTGPDHHDDQPFGLVIRIGASNPRGYDAIVAPVPAGSFDSGRNKQDFAGWGVALVASVA
jgi:hypothetical protein